MKEIILKQWSADDLSYNKQLILSFCHCNKNGVMSWAEILRFTSDAAGEDFTMRDMPWTYLMEKNLVFVVSRVSFHVLKNPVYDQNITLRTWEEAPQGPLFVRRFQITDTQTGEVLINAFTIWTLLDVKLRKIIPSKAFDLRVAPTLSSDYDGIKPGKISLPENAEIIGEHKVVFSDMDANGHVNNSKYINFAIDNLPEEFHNIIFKDMRLNYSKEAKDVWAYINENIPNDNSQIKEKSLAQSKDKSIEKSIDKKKEIAKEHSNLNNQSNVSIESVEKEKSVHIENENKEDEEKNN